MSKQKNFSRIFKQIAIENKTTVAEVYREMELAILFGANNKSPDIQAQLEKVPKRGKIPTPEEVIKYIANKKEQ